MTVDGRPSGLSTSQAADGAPKTVVATVGKSRVVGEMSLAAFVDQVLSAVSTGESIHIQ